MEVYLTWLIDCFTVCFLVTIVSNHSELGSIQTGPTSSELSSSNTRHYIMLCMDKRKTYCILCARTLTGNIKSYAFYFIFQSSKEIWLYFIYEINRMFEPMIHTCYKKWHIFLNFEAIIVGRKTYLKRVYLLNVLCSLAFHLTLNAFDNDMFLAFKFNMHIVIYIEIYCAWRG